MKPHLKGLSMTLRKTLLIIAPIILIFGYQNCQKSNFENLPQSVNYVPADHQLKQVIPLNQESVVSLQFKSDRVIEVYQAGQKYSVIKSFLYDFNLANGQISVIDQQSETNEKYCLTDLLKKQIDALIEKSSICKSGDQNVAGQVCAQVIKDGYANLITNRDQFKLGSATDSCGSNQIDLCENADQLKAWFESLKPQLETMRCKF